MTNETETKRHLSAHDELMILVNRLKLDVQELKKALDDELGEWVKAPAPLFSLINNLDSIITDWEDAQPSVTVVSTLWDDK